MGGGSGNCLARMRGPRRVAPRARARVSASRRRPVLEETGHQVHLHIVRAWAMATVPHHEPAHRRAIGIFVSRPMLQRTSRASSGVHQTGPCGTVLSHPPPDATRRSTTETRTLATEHGGSVSESVSTSIKFSTRDLFATLLRYSCRNSCCALNFSRRSLLDGNQPAAAQLRGSSSTHRFDSVFYSSTLWWYGGTAGVCGKFGVCLLGVETGVYGVYGVYGRCGSVSRRERVLSSDTQ